MKTAKLFVNGQSQAVRLPKEYRFSGDEVGIMKVGEMVMLYPHEKGDELFFSSIGGFTEDFYQSIVSTQDESSPDSPREAL